MRRRTRTDAVLFILNTFLKETWLAGYSQGQTREKYCKIIDSLTYHINNMP